MNYSSPTHFEMLTNKFLTLKTRLQDLKKIFQMDININELGIVILSLEDFSRILSREKDFKDSHFTPEEIEYCKNRMSSLAGRYSAKLALREALREQIPWKHMSILPSATSQPVVSFSKINERKRRVSLSITHEDDLVVAVAAIAADKTVALGIDATKNKRIADMVKNQPNILSRILTPKELAEMGNFKGVTPNGIASSDKNPPPPPFNKGGLKHVPPFIKGEKGNFFAMTKIWAAKEAVSKALGVGVWHGGSLQSIEILTKKGKPTVRLKGELEEFAKSLEINKWKLEFVYDGEFTVALVVSSS